MCLHCSLKKIVKAWNSENKKDQIKINLLSKNSKDFIWEKIMEKLKKKCKNEWCLLNMHFIKKTKDEEILNHTFLPEKLSEWYINSRQWLTTLDIEAVLNQYENKIDDFLFIGPVPLDFDKTYGPGLCIVDELCKLKLKDLIKEKIFKLGVVFNLDPHDKPGSHWVALYADLNKNEIYYFDSYGLEPPNEIENLMNRMKEQGKELSKNIDLYYNDIRHQFKNSECGVYCIHFIIQFLEGKSFKKIIENVIFDDEMNKNRDIYFRPSCNKKHINLHIFLLALSQLIKLPV